MTTSTPERFHTSTAALQATDDFLQEQRRLLGIAGRICGSRAEADDVVQDAWLRWQRCDRDQVLNPTAFLVTTTTRLAINVQQSARVCRETSVGHWIVEPSDAGIRDPWSGIEHDEVLGRGLRVLMQRLAPLERAAFLLRHAFDYAYPATRRTARGLRSERSPDRQSRRAASAERAAPRRGCRRAPTARRGVHVRRARRRRHSARISAAQGARGGVARSELTSVSQTSVLAGRLPDRPVPPRTGRRPLLLLASDVADPRRR